LIKLSRGVSNLAKELKPSATLSLKEGVGSLEKEYGFKMEKGNVAIRIDKRSTLI